MYTRIFQFFNNNNLFYPLQFGFRQNYSTTHALISLTETIRKYLGEGKFAYGIFVDLQKVFDTVEQDILLTKLEHYGVRGLTNDWFKSYLSDRKQFASINGHVSNLACFLYSLPQGSVLGPLLFLIYINDLNQAIKFCKVYHFADDINLLYFSKSITKLNEYVNLDMKNLTDWLNANKISLNVQKTELVIFKHQRKKIDNEVKIKLSRTRLYPTDSVIYLGIRIDENLNWKHHVSDNAIKLNIANALLFKVRRFPNVNTLKTIYYTIFDSYISYANVVWAQNANVVNRVSILQKKTLRIISFQPRDYLLRANLLRFNEKIQLENVLLVSKYFNNILPSIFDH